MTQKTTVRKQDTRTLAQVARSVSAMRRRIGAITRKHNKLQERIARLEAEGRIVKLSHYNDILTGIECWYVKADSLNPNPDSINNWYYEVTYSAERGYGCGCEDVRQCDCKHAKALGSYLHQEQEERQVSRTRKEQEAASRFGLTVEQVRETLAMPATVLNNANRGFQMMR